MNFRPNPLLYGSNENFYSTFRLQIVLHSSADIRVLTEAVSNAMERYPYFAVRSVVQEDCIVLKSNTLPVLVFPDDRTVTLGTKESNFHLLTFGCKGRNIYMDCSHYIADGVGISPLLNTVLYLYFAEIYGTLGLNNTKIRLPGSDVPKGEYVYPFPDEPISCSDFLLCDKTYEEAYSLESDSFDKDGLYAYHLHISQKDLMAKACTTDGSPVSILSVILYNALCHIDPDMDRSVVVHVQHQYRPSLGLPLCHHSLVDYIPVTLPPKFRNFSLDMQNTILRGQIILHGDVSEDIKAVNRLVSAFPHSGTLAEKRQSMADFSNRSITGKTFGISYVGKTDWCGMEKYIEDMHIYIGEKHTKDMLLMEVINIGDVFSVTFMQSGRGDKYIREFVCKLNEYGISSELTGENRYCLCDTQI